MPVYFVRVDLANTLDRM